MSAEAGESLEAPGPAIVTSAAEKQNTARDLISNKEDEAHRVLITDLPMCTMAHACPHSQPQVHTRVNQLPCS